MIRLVKIVFTKIFFFIPLLFVCILCSAKEVQWHGMSFQTNDGVEVKSNDDSCDFIFPGYGKSFTLSACGEISKKMMKPISERMIAGAKNEIKSQKKKVKNITSHDSIYIGIFSGIEVEIIIDDSKSRSESRQYLYILSEGKSGFSGTFTCNSLNDTYILKNILKSAKKIK